MQGQGRIGEIVGRVRRESLDTCRRDAHDKGRISMFCVSIQDFDVGFTAVEKLTEFVVQSDKFGGCLLALMEREVSLEIGK